LTHSAEPLASNGVVQLQGITPKRFVAERIEPERLPALFNHSQGITLRLLESFLLARLDAAGLAIWWLLSHDERAYGKRA
jgi:hypothetical protein